jgi:hypothetical protein
MGAAKVYSSLNNTSCEVQSKPSHLYEISKTENQHWKMLVDLLIKHDWKRGKLADLILESVRIQEIVGGLSVEEQDYVKEHSAKMLKTREFFTNAGLKVAGMAVKALGSEPTPTFSIELERMTLNTQSHC